MSQNSSPDDVPGAKQGTADSLAAPGCAGAGGTMCPHCGEALIPSADVFDRMCGFIHEECKCRVAARAEHNKARWLSISNFLATQNLRQVLQARQRSVAAGVAGAAQAASAAPGASHSLPVGNHGEIVAKGVSA